MIISGNTKLDLKDSDNPITHTEISIYTVIDN